MAPPDPGDFSSSASGEWIDISRPVHPQIPVWPGDQPYELHQVREPGYVESFVTTTCHVGTHLDAPLHFDDRAVGVEGVPVELCVGPAEVLLIPPGVGAATPVHLPPDWTPSAPRVLIRTDSHPLDGVIGREFTGLSAELVNWLADRGVGLIGIDTPSVDVFKSDDHPAHRAVLARHLIAIEGLWLDEVEPGAYHLIALPILLQGAEAAPVRAILKPLGGQF